MPVTRAYEVVVLGATPGGIAAALAAARRGRQVLLLERSAHVGGLPANGLGVTDIVTREATGGIFKEFVRRIRERYVSAYGPDSPQAADCDGGYRFEPHVAEETFERMLGEQQRRITVLRRRQFTCARANVQLYGPRVVAIRVQNRDTRRYEVYGGKVFIDATYEGDLAAAADAPYRIGRESRNEFGEPGAGKVYWDWTSGEFLDGTTGEGDRAVQAYNYRICLTRAPRNRVAIEKPADYRREEYLPVLEDVRAGRLRHAVYGYPRAACAKPVPLPNGKFDANDHPKALTSTDLAEENWPYPEADWDWRDAFAQRLRDYELGLLWFCQHDPDLPEEFRREALEWGLPADEYADNGHFPRQLYVREGRRIEGEYVFTALDCIAPGDLPRAADILAHRAEPHPDERPPLHADSITAAHYPIDSHACHRREPDKPVREGYLAFDRLTRPCQVPYGVIVPKKVEGLLTPVPCSASHLGFATLRMEPCWMALGQAAGIAADLAIERHTVPRAVHADQLQRALLRQKAVLMYFRDLPEDHPHAAAIQYFGLRGIFRGFLCEPDKPVTPEEAARWAALGAPPERPGAVTRGQYLQRLYDRLA